MEMADDELSLHMWNMPDTPPLKQIVEDAQRDLTTEYIRAVMEYHGWSAAELARRAGVAPSTITRALDPEVKFVPSSRTMTKIRAASEELSVADYLRKLTAESPGLAKFVSRLDTRVRRVPVLGEVRAGAWLEVPEDPAPTEFVFVDEEDYPDQRLFALRVIGSSMDQIYPEGTTIIAAETINASVFDGDVVVVRRFHSPLCETTIKQVEASTESGRFLLWPRSNDPAFQEPIVIDRDAQADDGPQIIGVVVASYARRPRQSRRLIDFGG